MIKKSIILVIAICFLSQANAQSSDSVITKTINKLFSAMKMANDSLILDCFSNNARLQSITRSADDKNVIVNTFLPKDFATNVIKRPQGSYDERIIGNDLSIKNDGELTMAWVPYVFYLDGKFSHCGVDLFSFIQDHGEYKISNLVFNMRKTECKQ